MTRKDHQMEAVISLLAPNVSGSGEKMEKRRVHVKAKRGKQFTFEKIIMHYPTFNLIFFVDFLKNDKSQNTCLHQKADWDCETVSTCKDHQIFPSFAPGEKYLLPENFFKK